MNKKSLIATFILFTTSWLVGCEKQPGEGGNATIKGIVKMQEHIVPSQFEASYFAKDYKVYLIFGEDTAFDLDTRTSYDGSFAFESLRTGKYQIFVYSDCFPPDPNCDDSGIETVIQSIEITKSNQEVLLDTLIVKKW